MNFILFHPLYQERVWGGSRLARSLGRSLPDERLIGESWEIVDRPEAQSIIAGGTLSGLTLRQAIESHASDLLGLTYPAHQPFPILVKWLDCRERLSLQVHPPAAVAGELKGEPKSENWYIAEVDSGAGLLAGLKRGVTRDQFESALSEHALEPLIHRIRSCPGDSLFVPSGRIHAIDAGNLILEIQQNSDTTYRVYDWGRIGLNGKPRHLHIEESLRSINFEDFEPEVVSAGEEECTIAQCAEFRIRRITIKPGAASLDFAAGEQPRLLHIVSGNLRERDDGGILRRGDNALLPFCGSFSFVAKEDSVVLITDQFIP